MGLKSDKIEGERERERVSEGEIHRERLRKTERMDQNTIPIDGRGYQLSEQYESSTGGNAVVGYLLTFVSILTVVLTFPLSLFFVIKVCK